MIAPRILLADADAEVRHVLRRVLTHDLGAAITEALDGASALESLERQPFDVAIIGLRLPVIDGVEVLEAIRQSAVFATLPVVVVTGPADERSVHRIRALAIDGLLAKPLSLPLLRARLVPLIQSLRPPVEAEPQPTPLHVTTRVLATGIHGAALELLTAALEPLVTFRLVASVPAGLRDALAWHPHIIAVGTADLLLTPTLFARAVRRERRSDTRIIVCETAEATAETTPADVDTRWTEPFTHDGLLNALAPFVTPPDLARIILGPASPAVAAALEWMRLEIASAVPAPAVTAVPPPSAQALVHGVAVTTRLVVDHQVWHVGITGARVMALEYAAIGGKKRHSDRVSDDVAVSAIHDLALGIATRLVDALRARGIEARHEEATSVSGVLPSGRRSDVHWWVVGKTGDVQCAGHIAAAVAG
ncbi:MAG: response regulator [Acidobacteria bacterium]|nr:response regulator [Acidobacteriota bacterium]